MTWRANVLALEKILCTRIVSTPAAISTARVTNSSVLLHIAADELLAVGGFVVSVDDPHAIIEAEAGLSGAWLNPTQMRALVLGAVDWDTTAASAMLDADQSDSSTATGMLLQGLLHFVPVKVWVSAARNLLLCPTPYKHELEGRLR
jgi:hypothetical protein